MDRANKLQIDQRQIGVMAHMQRPFAISQCKDAGRRSAQQRADAAQRQTTLVVPLVQQHRQDGGRAGESLRGQPEALVLGGTLARHMVGGHHVHRAIGQALPQRLLVIAVAERRVGLAHAAQRHISGMRQVMRAGLDVHALVAAAPTPHFFKPHT